MHPADELHALRAEIRLLREREAALRRRMIADPGGPACEGATWRAVVLSRSIRVLDPARLPASIRANPESYRLCTRRAVLLRPAEATDAGSADRDARAPARPGARNGSRGRLLARIGRCRGADQGGSPVDFELIPAE